MVGGSAAGAVTAMVNAGSETLVVPSLTLMVIFAYVPRLVVPGVPESWPVLVLKVAQAGLLAIAKVNLLPSASEAAGWNEYVDPAWTAVAGAPVIFGGVFVGGAGGIAVTGMENAAREAWLWPSLTLMTKSEKAPTC